MKSKASITLVAIQMILFSLQASASCKSIDEGLEDRVWQLYVKYSARAIGSGSDNPRIMSGEILNILHEDSDLYHRISSGHVSGSPYSSSGTPGDMILKIISCKKDQIQVAAALTASDQREFNKCLGQYKEMKSLISQYEQGVVADNRAALAEISSDSRKSRECLALGLRVAERKINNADVNGERLKNGVEILIADLDKNKKDGSQWWGSKAARFFNPVRPAVAGEAAANGAR